MQNWRRNLILTSAVFTALFLISVFVIWRQDRVIQEKLTSGVFLPPWEIYSQGYPISVGRPFDKASVQALLQKNHWRERSLEQALTGEDYKWLNADACEDETRLDLRRETSECLLLSNEQKTPVLVGLGENVVVSEIWQGDPLQPKRALGLLPSLVAQLSDGQPILKKQTPLGEIPLICLQAVTAIEDAQFLEHSGVSFTGILRAILRNLRAGRWAEGGSTITQQLVKNFFLTPKKTLRRKVQEQILAILLEIRAGKDFILEMYANVIYMGQNGPYQVRGLGSAAEYYFDQKVSELDLPQCALLAALINSPGRYSPFDRQDAAKTRRHLVLQKMLDLKMISESEMTTADQMPLPHRPPQQKREPAPFYLSAVLRELKELDLSGGDHGLRVFTSLDPELQAAASSVLATQTPVIENKVKNKGKTPLQAALISVDLYTSQVLALVGGRDFRSTQFNRVLDGRRQIGSIVKPFVYWPAMESKSPLDLLQDTPFEWKMGSQRWRPKNYEGKALGPVPAFWALANSLNMSTAHLGQEIGLKVIAQTLVDAGLTETPPLLPSLTLGALELSPWQVAQIYSTLANFGQFELLHTISRVEDGNGQLLYEYQADREPHLNPESAAVVVGMLKQTPRIGTARSLATMAEKTPLAGKTGTTSDTKDAWFVGFTPRLLNVVWVGYDDNTAMGLTGASAALPIWAAYFQAIQGKLPSEDFNWPARTAKRSLSRTNLVQLLPNVPEANLPENIELILLTP